MSNRNCNSRITVDILGDQNDIEMEDSDSQEDEPPSISQAPLNRKLVDEFVRPSLDPLRDQHMKVYLRIRPFSAEEINKSEKQDCLAVESDHVVSTHPPKDSHTYKNATRGVTKSIAKYTFSHIFNENTSQKEFFNDTMLGLVKDFIDGQNCLVFSYGVTSSGKTYTIQGNPKDAGILPRALDVLFNSIHGQQWEPMNLKPKLFVGVQKLTADEELRERKIKEKVLKLSLDDDMDVMSLLGDDASDISVATNTTTCSESSNISSMDHKESIESSDRLFAELDNRVREEARVNVQDQGNIKFSVWVSFAEIYNEQIYDLLEPIPKKKNARRPCLKLSEDKNGSPYIKGLKEINVNSADEAYKLMTIGQRNLRTACTKLNQNSSRSHCIFNIKILRVVDKNSPQVARVSMLSLCDLAGSERYTKSQTTGDRLKEAGNINTSLLTLGRCIETLKYNQHHKDSSRIVPFRDSKLTRLFQNFFVGQGKAAMIVNVNQCASMFDETLHVFKFSAIASQVVVIQKPVFIKPKLPVIAASPTPIPRSSIMWATPARTTALANQTEAENVQLPEDEDEDLEEQVYTQENIDELIVIIEDLQEELAKEQRKNIKMESTLRAEIVQEFKKQFIEIEQEYSEEMRLREEMQDDLAEKRLKLLVDAKLSKKDTEERITDEDDEWVSSVLLHQEKVKVEERDNKIKKLKEKLASLDAKVHNLTESQEKAEKERDNMARQLENSQKVNDELQKELSAKNTTYIENLQTQMSGYEEKIKELEGLLEKEREREEDNNKAALIENLTQQLTQSRDKVKEQEKEISELNDMLTEAGETFEQRETELEKLKDLVQEYEQKLEAQSEAIKALEQAAADSRVAMETADQSLSKREECVSTLQAEIRELQGDVHKYQNKAKFFEEAAAEKEQEIGQWKQKYEQDKDEHAKNQEALIHGFTAEISNLRSQIFHFKTQLVKSPTKSPGNALRSPDIKSGHVFSPKSSTPKMQKLDFAHDVQEQIGLQTEMNKNVASVSELEHALHVSRSAVDDLEKKLTASDEKNKLAESRIEELECRLRPHHEINENSDSELIEAKQRIVDLENQLKVHVEKLAKQSENELEIDNLNEQLNLKNKTICDLENQQRQLETQVKELKHAIKEKENDLEKHEHKVEELEVLNSELKDMVNKTTNDLQTKDLELQMLSPKSAATLKNSDKVETQDEKEKQKYELQLKTMEVDMLNEKVRKLKAGFKAEEELLKETKRKYSILRFTIDEKEASNQDLREEFVHKIEEKGSELTQTGEELAVAMSEVAKLKRINAEKDAVINMKEHAITELKEKVKEQELGKIVDKQSSHCEEIVILKKSVEEKTSNLKLLEAELLKYKETLKEKDERLSKMDGLSEEILKLQSLMKGKEDKIHELLSEMKTLKEEIDTLNSCKKETECLKKQVTELKCSLADKEEELAMLSDNLSAVLDEKEIEDKNLEDIKKLKHRIHDLEVQLQERQNEIRKNNSIDAPHQSASSNVDIVESQKALLDSQNKKIKELENKLSCLSEQIKEKGNLEESFRDLESAVVDKEVEICNKDKEMECKTAEVDCLTARIALLETELKTKSEEIKELESINENRTHKVKEHTEKMDNVSQQLCDANAKAEELKVLLRSSKDKCDGLEKETKSLNDQLREKSSVIENCEKELHIADGKVKCVLEKNNELEIALEGKSRELKELKEAYNELKQQIDSNNIDEAKLADAMLEIAELKSTVHTHKTLHHNLKGELEEALLELENKRSEANTLKKENEFNKKFEDQLNAKDRELHEAKTKMSELEEELNKTMESVSKVQDSQKDLEEARHTIEELRNQTVTLRSDLDRSQNRAGLLEQEIHDIHADCDEKLAAVSEMKTEVHRLVETKRIAVKTLGEENQSLKTELMNRKTSHEQALTKLQAEIESLKQEKDKLSEQESVLNSQKEVEIAQITCEKEKEMKKLTLVIDDLKSEIKELKHGLREVESENADLKAEVQELKSERNRLLGVQGEKTELEEMCNSLKTELLDLKDVLKNEENQCQILTEEVRKLEKLHDSQNEKDDNVDSEKNASQKIAELQSLYDSEKLRNEEYQKIIRELNEQNCLSPQSGIRKVRKDKIDAENALIEARFTISSLEKKLKDSEINSELKQSVLVNNQSTSVSESVLQQKLNKATAKLHEVEGNNRSLIKEVTQLQGTVERLQRSLEDEKQRYEAMVEAEACQRTVASVVQADPRQSISSPSTKVELSKSREREQALHEQLNKAKVTIQEWSHKFTTIENDLRQKTEELQDAKDKVTVLERNKLEGSKLNDEERQKYQERISDLERDIIQKEDHLECNKILMDELKQQLDTGLASMNSFKQDVKSKDETIALLKETLGEQENMLQMQEEYINKKEEEINSGKTDHQSLLDKYQAILMTKETNQHEHLEEAKNAARTEAERDLLKEQLQEVELRLQRAVEDRERANQMLKEVEHKLERTEDDRERTNQLLREGQHKADRLGEEKERTNRNLVDVEHRLQRAVEEKERSDRALTENNKELREMEKMLTDVRKECEDLRAQGSDKHAETRLENLRHDLEKQIHDLQNKNKELHAELKDVKSKFQMTKETLKVAVEERHGHEKTLKRYLQDFREERDKLVSGLEAILKKKDAEIKQYKEQIKQLKDKEEQLTKSWQEEREKNVSGSQHVQKNKGTQLVKQEPVDEDSSGDNRAHRSPVRKGSYREAMTPLSPENNVVSSSNSRVRPARPDAPQVQISTESSDSVFKSPPRRTNSRSRANTETPGSASISESTTQQRGSSRRGRKRSPVHREDDLPPIPPKRVSTDTSLMSESDDVSSHLQVDATPTVAAKTLRRTRKKNGSQLDLSAVEETTSSRPQRSSKRSARSRILESFRESPLAKGSKRILDNITEAFSPKSSPTKSPTKDRDSNQGDKKSRADSKENLATPSSLEVHEKKPAGRGRGRHKLYKEDTYISEPMEFKGDFVKSPEDVHKTVTRSLRSRRH